MPPAEQRGSEPPREQAPLPEYYQAAWYVDEASAGQAYLQAQQALFTTKLELSAYRFRLDQVSYVTVLGDTPPVEFDHILQTILANGEPAPLSNDILMTLNQRRIQARGLGTWVERHYRPGKPIGG